MDARVKMRDLAGGFGLPHPGRKTLVAQLLRQAAGSAEPLALDPDSLARAFRRVIDGGSARCFGMRRARQAPKFESTATAESPALAARAIRHDLTKDLAELQQAQLHYMLCTPFAPRA